MKISGYFKGVKCNFSYFYIASAYFRIIIFSTIRNIILRSLYAPSIQEIPKKKKRQVGLTFVSCHVEIVKEQQ
jgi:dolichyl-phosphate-mannose--protein O-mannosyl transferase